LAAQQRRKVQAGDSLMAKLWQERSVASAHGAAKRAIPRKPDWAT